MLFIVDAHKTHFGEGSFINIPYTFFVRDATSLPTSFLNEHDNKFERFNLQQQEDEEFPFKYVLHDDDIQPYTTRWVDDRWDSGQVGVHVAEGPVQPTISAARKGKRPRQEHIEQRVKNNQQRGLSLSPEYGSGEEDHNDQDDISIFVDEDLLIDTDEAREVQQSLWGFTATEMMP